MNAFFGVLGAALLGLIAIAFMRGRSSRLDDDRGSVSEGWLAEKRGTRDDEE